MAAEQSIVILGAGYAGMYTALRLKRRLKKPLARGEVRITLIDPESYMTYQPFLPETAAGSLEPRHITVNLRRTLAGCSIVNGSVNRIDSASQQVSYRSAAGEELEIGYDTLVVALGSVSRLLPIPGLREHGVGIKTVGEAVLLHNHVLYQLDIAASTSDPELRAKALTFVVVGGGFAGIETLAELEDMTRAAVADYPNLSQEDLRWILVEASDRILPELGAPVSLRTLEMLKARGVEMRLETFLESAKDEVMKLSTGESFPAATLIWTAGVKANPVLASSDLPLDKQGRLEARPDLRVQGIDNVWVAGDCGAIPDLARPGELTPPSAQHAIRQARRLADNIVAVRRGKTPKEYFHKNAGAVAGLGLYRGAAQVGRISLRGFPAWVFHRVYHGAMMPTFNRKVRVFVDWSLALFSGREVTAIPELYSPRSEFERTGR